MSEYLGEEYIMSWSTKTAKESRSLPEPINILFISNEEDFHAMSRVTKILKRHL